MKTILCPTDFSSTADNAIAYAAKMAKHVHADLTLLNVQSLLERAPVEAIWGEDWNVETASARLEAQCREVQNVFKIPCDSEVATAITSTTKTIGEVAKKYDLVIMGTKGPTDLFHFFAGSNTYNVIRKSSTPVLLIPEGCGYTDVTQVVYAFDYWRKADLPIRQLINFTKPLQSKLTVLQIMEESVSLKAKKETQEFQQLVKELYPEEPLDFDTIHTGTLINSIHHYMLEHEADVLALCAEDHGFIEALFHKSVIKAFTVIAKYPVFVFHE
jgi:nucleotide-binding universal stress UspA family protein